MIFKSEYCVLVIDMKFSEDSHHEHLVDRIHIGDEVTIRRTSGEARAGKISLITVKGIYLDVGNKKDKYFRLDEIEKVERY